MVSVLTRISGASGKSFFILRLIWRGDHRFFSRASM
jgi:hypothetical protein